MPKHYAKDIPHYDYIDNNKCLIADTAVDSTGRYFDDKNTFNWWCNLADDKRQKLAWLSGNTEILSDNLLKCHYFLFFYEIFQGLADDTINTAYLTAYINDIDDYITYKESNSYNVNVFDTDIAHATRYLIATFSEDELLQLVQSFDLWTDVTNDTDVPVVISTISELDKSRFEDILDHYTTMATLDITIINVADTVFLITKEDERNAQKIPEYTALLEALSQNDTLENPVYLSVKDGRLLVD